MVQMLTNKKNNNKSEKATQIFFPPWPVDACVCKHGSPVLQISVCSGTLSGGGWLLTGGKGAAGVPGLTPVPGPADQSPKTRLPTPTRLQLSSLRLTRSHKGSNTRLPSRLAAPRSMWLGRRSGL